MPAETVVPTPSSTSSSMMDPSLALLTTLQAVTVTLVFYLVYHSKKEPTKEEAAVEE